MNGITKILAVVFLMAAVFNTYAQDCSTLVAEPLNTYFVLVVDRSGSMAGQALSDAKSAVVQFINRMQPSDSAAIVTFEDKVQVLHNFSADRSSLINKVIGIQPGGMTCFYDAVATSAKLLSRVSGQKAIVFLTDGNDNASSFTLSNIRSMNIGEGNTVYGIGLGDVNHSEIRAISGATGGVYKIAGNSSQLYSLYDELQQYHYNTVNKQYKTTGGYSISSLPGNRPVLIDGKEAGRTPLRIDGIEEGLHTVQIKFDTGMWKCSGNIKAGYRNIIQARAADLPAEFIIESAPGAASVFIDDIYVGMTSRIPSAKTSSGPDYSNQLHIKSLPAGMHHVKIIAVPDKNISESQVMEFDFEMRRTSRYVNVLIFMGQAHFKNGEIIKRDPFASFKTLGGFPEGFKASPFGN